MFTTHTGCDIFNPHRSAQQSLTIMWQLLFSQRKSIDCFWAAPDFYWFSQYRIGCYNLSLEYDNEVYRGLWMHFSIKSGFDTSILSSSCTSSWKKITILYQLRELLRSCWPEQVIQFSAKLKLFVPVDFQLFIFFSFWLIHKISMTTKACHIWTLM